MMTISLALVLLAAAFAAGVMAYVYLGEFL
jgi:hypothetical protein